MTHPHYPPPMYSQAVGSYTYYPGQSFGAAPIAESFDCEAVWRDAQRGGTVVGLMKGLKDCQAKGDPALCGPIEQQIGAANAAGARAADKVREGLNALGYGPLKRGVVWGSADRAAWGKFADDHDVPAGPGLVSHAGLCAMQDKLSGGAMAGLGTWGLLLLLAAGGAAVYVVSKKKGKGARLK